jgi:hypothetical protein
MEHVPSRVPVWTTPNNQTKNMFNFIRSLFSDQPPSSRDTMNNIAIFYKTKDCQANYRFTFEHQSNSTWRVYIFSQPSYRGRSEGANETHRLTDGGRKYICWTTPIRSLPDAKKVAAAWADKTQEYIRTGARF